jgi:hypothetical protein
MHELLPDDLKMDVRELPIGERHGLWHMSVEDKRFSGRPETTLSHYGLRRSSKLQNWLEFSELGKDNKPVYVFPRLSPDLAEAQG